MSNYSQSVKRSQVKIAFLAIFLLDPLIRQC